MSNQKENIKKLIELTQKYPELEIVPMVDMDGQGDNCGYWTAKWGEPSVDYVYYSEERVYFKNDDSEELADEYWDENCKENMSAEELEQLEINTDNYVESLNWKQVIAININSL